eukprot:375248_1
MRHNSNKKHKPSIKLSKFMKLKWNRKICKKSKKQVPSPDDFIKQYAQTNTNNLTDIKSLDLRRKIFISLICLFNTWKDCPNHILYSSIFLVPLKRAWIYNPSEYTEEIGSHFISKMNIFSDATEINQFIELLKWKDHQHLIFWMLDEYENTDNNNNPLINPFWFDINKKLTNLYDPITGNTYNEINLNMEWWENKNKYISKYNVKTSSILAEFYFLTKKFCCIQEILYQSNPKSFDVIKSYKKYDCTTTDDF